MLGVRHRFRNSCLFVLKKKRVGKPQKPNPPCSLVRPNRIAAVALMDGGDVFTTKVAVAASQVFS